MPRDRTPRSEAARARETSRTQRAASERDHAKTNTTLTCSKELIVKNEIVTSNMNLS